MITGPLPGKPKRSGYVITSDQPYYPDVSYADTLGEALKKLRELEEFEEDCMYSQNFTIAKIVSVKFKQGSMV